MLLPIAFALLLVLSAMRLRGAMLRRSGPEWAADLSGLVMQGVVVPFLQTAVLATALVAIEPRLRGSLDVSATTAFLLNFVVVDWLYYWNHRLLHTKLWRWHLMHHTATSMDVLVTSRNTLWTPLLIVYVWVNALMVVLLDAPGGYLAAMTLTAALDLWRHSPLHLPSRINAVVSLLFITSREHAWHHGSASTEVNFGANFSLWDRLHGTYRAPVGLPQILGVPLPETPARGILLPIPREAMR